MMDHAYTADELHELRALCGEYWDCGVPGINSITRFSFNSTERSVTIEEMMRTYIAAGLTANELRAADEVRVKQHGWLQAVPASQTMT